MAQQVLAGTWEEIVRHADELAGQHVRVTVLTEEPSATPNEKAPTVLRELQERQKGRRRTSGENTQRMLRQARAGGMYGLEPTEE